jgi:hypothetical protein
VNESVHVPHGDEMRRKYVFVGGLQRSGTSVLVRNVARLENCTGFKNTGVLQDEGKYLQDVYPTDHAYGGSGRYGFDPRAHLTETSNLLTPENVARLRASWHAYWDNSKTICVEKTPGNLLMTRFLQAAFPNSFFIVIKRHPVAVSMATQRWKRPSHNRAVPNVSVTAIHRLFEHWLHCYGIFDEDKRYLKHVYELTYERYVENPDKYHQEIARFIGTGVPEVPKDDEFRRVPQGRNPTGLRVPERGLEIPSAVYSKKYFDRWSNCLTRSPFKRYYRYIAAKYEPEFARYGYSLVKGFSENGEALGLDSKVSALLGPVYCLGADLGALLRRTATQPSGRVKRGIKRILPEFVLNRIRQTRHNALLRHRRA